MPGPTAVTIGNFDGVHIGHAALVRRARELVGPSGRVVVLAFDAHPLTQLRPEFAPARLSTFEQRTEWLRALGADDIQRLDPSPDLLSLPPREFLRRHVAPLSPVAVVEGADFRFGAGRAGNVSTLSESGAEFGFEAVVVDPVETTLSDQTVVRASSTIARWLVANGRARDAALVLGRPYELMGVVVRGDRRGREIGYPTANLETGLLLPGDGVYAGQATLPDGRVMPAAISVGTKPTFGRSERVSEAFVLDWRGPVPEGGPEYGWALRLTLNSWIRDQIRFDSLDSLLEQMSRDVKRTREIMDKGAACAGARAKRDTAEALA